VGKALRDHDLRIDARSLGLFRLAFALVLLADLFRRWRHLKEFYSNEGVLPNHNHLFNLRESGQVWSVLHAFSSPDENYFAFVLILLVYVTFLVGYQTRVFHALSLACLVSLTARNILLENAGNYAAIGLLAFTLFLPLGSRFSLDSLRASMAARDEKTAAELNDRPEIGVDVVQAERSPGWTPTSLAAFAVLAQIAVIYLATALQQRGAWRDGTALYYALNAQRWVSGAGAAARALPADLLSIWTRGLYLAGWAIPVLIFVPVAFRRTRWAAIGLLIFHALTLGVFFSFGLYAWSLLAAAALLIPCETWDRVERASQERRLRTVIYDADCGMCLWLARLLTRLDLRHNLTLQGNDDIAELLVGKPHGAIYRIVPPKELTDEVVVETVVVVDPAGRAFTRSRAVSEVIQALPFGWLVAWMMRVPGIAQLLDRLYDAVAARRQQISVAFGKAACGIPPPSAKDGEAEDDRAASPDVAPATVLTRRIFGSFREIVVAVMFVAMLAQTARANALSVTIPQGKVLAAIAAWPRMLARWNVLTPEPPKVDEVFVVDAQTRTNQSVDPLTGREPQVNPGAMRGTGLGQLWDDYLTRIHDKEWYEFQKGFRDYLPKGGPGWSDATGDRQIGGFDAYWVKQPIPAPGEERTAEATREKLFNYSRGGRLGADKALPSLRPDSKRR
jgi:predicted DCC family thiol-disulfide oxidoreductase YuxK